MRQNKYHQTIELGAPVTGHVQGRKEIRVGLDLLAADFIAQNFTEAFFDSLYLWLGMTGRRALYE